MRSPVNRQPRHFGLLLFATVASLASLLAAPLLARQRDAEPVAPSGPAADYPMVLGAPYTVDGATYTPADVMNYDQVGYAVAEPGAGAGVTIAHRTLPLPSYVEVTSLKTGRTILARVERRGPMAGPSFIGLSPAAAAQLGAANDGPDSRTPVRVRRVNPPEQERALLRTGQTAPVRMDTPMSLVGVLLRKLDPALAPPPPVPTATATPAAPAVTAQKPPVPQPKTPVAPALRQAGRPAAQDKLPLGQAGAHPEPTPKPAVSAAPKPVSTPKASTPPAPKPPVSAEPKPEPNPKPEPKPQTKPKPKPATGKVVVQVGAFSTRERAESAATRVGGTVTPAGKLFRVRITGFAAPAEAAAALAKAKGAGYSDARIQRAD